MLKNLIFFICLIAVVRSREVCYDELGCFSDSSPFSGTIQRPISFLPDSPQKISVKFSLYNRKLANQREIITANFTGDYFDSNVPTKFIIHGFLDTENKQWVKDLKDTLINAQNVNVIVVDWSKGNGFPYTQATANTRVVGAEIARLISVLISRKGIDPLSIHLIGHSLGSHISGYAGERIPGIGRITGLDPAGPYFENTDPKVRLDPSDAVFVEAIHTDGTANLLLGLGLLQPVGHIDYYPNGGKDQPNCPATSGKLLSGIFNAVTLNFDGLEDAVACSHLAVLKYYTDSIKSNCKYTAFPCDSESDFNSGNCIKCSDKGCNSMGYWSSKTRDDGKLYLNTQSPVNSQYCKQSYVARLVSNNISGLSKAKGKFTIYFETSNEISSSEVFDDSNGVFKPDSVELRLVSLNEPLVNKIENVYITYQKTTNLLSSWLYDDKWSFESVEITNGDSQTTLKFCPVKPIINSNETVKFIKC